jgi:hypothetical protein
MPIAVIYIASALLALGAAPLPYGYYTFLRIVGCGVFAFASYITFTQKARVFPFIYSCLAVLFNPIMKVHLPKEVWSVVDLASAALLLANAKHMRADIRR